MHFYKTGVKTKSGKKTIKSEQLNYNLTQHGTQIIKKIIVIF